MSIGAPVCHTYNSNYSQGNGYAIKLGTTAIAFCGGVSLDQQYLTLLVGGGLGGLLGV